jgi:hypothetical protein
LVSGDVSAGGSIAQSWSVPSRRRLAAAVGRYHLASHSDCKRLTIMAVSGHPSPGPTQPSLLAVKVGKRAQRACLDAGVE